MNEIATTAECPTQSATPAASLSIPGYRHIRDAQALNRLTGNGNYTWIEFAGVKNPVLISQTLRYFERQLPDFIRVSKSTLLNPNCVVGTLREDARTVYLRLADESLVSIPRRRLTDVLNKLVSGVCPKTHS